MTLAIVLALGACHPVDSWRSLSGASKHDPNPATTPNGGNLAAGAALPYPNLATVPPPPTAELTTAQLKELTQSLVADRANARYTSQKLRAGMGQPGPPPSLPSTNPVSGAAGAVALAAVAPVPPPARSAAPLRPPAPLAAGATPPGGAAIAGAKPVRAAVPGLATGRTSGLRKPGQPPQPGPMESSLVSPTIPETPQPEAPAPAPPPPRLAAVTATTGGPAPLLAHLPAPSPPAALPQAAAIVPFQPPPPPVLAAPTPSPAAAAAPAGKKPAPPPVATPVATITFAAGSTGLDGADLAALAKVAALYRQNPAALRVVGYAAVGGDDPLESFRRALDHAQAVVAGLVQAGIPKAKIAAEAAPGTGASGGNRAVVLLVH